MTQFGMNWGMLAAALLIALPTFLSISDTTIAEEWEKDINGEYEEEQQHHQSTKT